MKTTDPQSEFFPLVDKNNNLIGKISRNNAHRSPSKIHRAIYVLVINEKRELLLQKRSKTKDIFPGCWDLSVGGHVSYGEEYLDTAVRESKEEIGLQIKIHDVKYLGEVLVSVSWEQEFFRVYEYYLKPTDTIKLSREEISDYKFIPMALVLRKMNEKPEEWSLKAKKVLETFY